MKPDGTTVPQSYFSMEKELSKVLKFANRLKAAGL